MGTNAYVLHSLLGGLFLVVKAILPLVDLFDQNWIEWVRLMAEKETTSIIVLAYLNTCILELTAAAEINLGACTLVSFQYLINEIDHGWYTVLALPWSLQDLLTYRMGKYADLTLAAALPPPPPQTIGRDGQAGGGGGGRGGIRGEVIVSRGRHQNNHNGEVITKPRPIKCIRILSWGNTRGMCWDVALPTLGIVAFCKRWYMRYIFFGDCARTALHLQPTGDIVDKVEEVMATYRAARLVCSTHLTSRRC